MLPGVMVVLPFSPHSVRAARSIVTDCGRELPRHLVEDAELLVSEVVTNALVHGAPALTLSVSADGDSMTVRVTDGGAGWPRMGPPGVRPGQPSGRGLRLVHRIATGWGVEVEPPSGDKTVWFRLTRGHGVGYAHGFAQSTEHAEGMTLWS